MGQAVPVLGALGKMQCLDSCSKYVCNAMSLHSRCCNCFEFEFETDKVDLQDDSSSEYSVEIVGCCHTRKE